MYDCHSVGTDEISEMKFFVVGPSKSHSSETSYARLLREKGCDVVVWDDKAPFPLSGKRDWWRLSRAERLIYDSIASLRFYNACRAYAPDVLFMPKAENIHFYAVKRALEETRARLVVWYPDNPFKADQTSMNILRDLKRCDLFYIWGRFLIDALRAAGCRRVEYLPFGFDPVLHPVTELDAPKTQEYACDVCFVGTWDKERERALKPLADFNLGIWGPLWAERVSTSSSLKKHIRGHGLYGSEIARAFRAAGIVFNHLRNHNGSAHNIRTMEITGIGGGPMVVRRTPEQAKELFTEGEHLVCFESNNELKRQVEWLLANPNTRLEMSRKAREHVFASHLLSFRIDHILHDLSRL
jgi:spore maturation protein CgeB